MQPEDLTHDDRPGKPRVPDCSPPAPTRRAPSSVQAHLAELVSRTSKENLRESLTSLERSPSPEQSCVLLRPLASTLRKGHSPDPINPTQG